MSVDIDYSKRSIFQNMFDGGAWENMLGGVNTIVGSGMDIYDRITARERERELLEAQQEKALAQQRAVASAYNPNWTWGDLAFRPNATLIVGGLGLLALAYYLSKRK